LKGWYWIGLAILITLPGVIVQFVALKYFEKEEPILGAMLWGFAVVGAAFLLSWAVEAVQEDVPKALAFSGLALLAVLPEYSVDFALTYQAGSNPEYQEFALANLIGANRMIVGFAWPLLVFIFWVKFRKTKIVLAVTQRVEIGFLLFAGLYSLILPIKGHIDLIDVAVFVGCFVIYTIRIARADVHEPELVGPAAVLGHLPKARRIPAVLLLLGFAGFVIFVSAHPFAESLITTGREIGVDEVLLVQWLAPLASEAPEIVVCVIFTLRALAADGLGALVASKVNQWTLLVGTLPLVYSLGAGSLKSLPLHDTVVVNGQTIEYDLIGPMLVTSAQTILATMVIINLSCGLKGAFILFALFIGQFFAPAFVNIGDFRLDTHYLFAGIYLVIALYIAVTQFQHFVPTFKSIVSLKYVREAEKTHISSNYDDSPEEADVTGTLKQQ
jgi:cation:H+ antiporter